MLTLNKKSKTSRKRKLSKKRKLRSMERLRLSSDRQYLMRSFIDICFNY